MKWTPVLLAALLGSSEAAVYTMDLSGAPAQSPMDGVDGWVQSEANYVDGEVYPRAFVHQLGTSAALALGGYYDSEAPTAGPGIDISHQVSGLGFNASSLALDFSLVDSDPFDADRNQFSIGFFDSSGDELISLVFRPNSQSATPDLTTATWNMYVSSGGVLGSSFGGVFEGDAISGGVYSLSLMTVPTGGGGVGYNINVSTPLGSQGTSGTLAGLGGEAVDSVRLGWLEDGSETFGTNFLAVANLVVAVPEPSSALLCLGAMLPLALRRRRARI
jgi:hypothetical protein